MNKILCFLLIIGCSIHSFASQDSIIVKQQYGMHVVQVNTKQDNTLVNIASNYNLAVEILTLFNTPKPSEVLPAQTAIIVPLVETNYYKNTSLRSNAGYQPMYYQAQAGDLVVDIAKKFLIAETTLYKWNQFASQQLQPNQMVLIGYLKTNDYKNKTLVTEPINTEKIIVGLDSETPQPTFADKAKKEFSTVKKNVNTAFTNIGTGIKKITSPKPKLDITALDSSNVSSNDIAVNNNKSTINLPKVDIKKKWNAATNSVGNAFNNLGSGIKKITSSKPKTAIAVADSAVVSSNDKALNNNKGAITLPKIDVKKKWDAATNAVGGAFKKTGASITKGFNQLKEKANTKPINTTIQEPTINNTTTNNAATTIKKQVIETPIADVQIVNHDAELSSGSASNVSIDPPTYQNENAGSSIYQIAENEVTKVANTDENKEKIVMKKIINTGKNPVKGKAITFYASGQGMHLAYTDYAPIGSMVVVKNIANGKSVEAKIIGALQKNGADDEGIFIILSDTVKKELKPTNENFIVEVSTPTP